MRQPTVADHLRALGEAPEWVLSLGEAICEITGCPAAIAASRARDLSRNHEIGRGLECLLKGWRTLDAQDVTALSPMQLESLHLVIAHMLSGLRQKVKGAQEADSPQQEVGV